MNNNDDNSHLVQELQVKDGVEGRFGDGGWGVLVHEDGMVACPGDDQLLRAVEWAATSPTSSVSSSSANTVHMGRRVV